MMFFLLTLACWTPSSTEEVDGDLSPEQEAEIARIIGAAKRHGCELPGLDLCEISFDPGDGWVTGPNIHLLPTDTHPNNQVMGITALREELAAMCPEKEPCWLQIGKDADNTYLLHLSKPGQNRSYHISRSLVEE